MADDFLQSYTSTKLMNPRMNFLIYVVYDLFTTSELSLTVKIIIA